MAKAGDGIFNMGNKNLGYIRVIEFTVGGNGVERTLDTFTAEELINLTKKDIVARFNIGEYAYLVVEKG